jgi:catechol 2,3-dioxygenase-like lactoylglutathione lyase family enzyme
MIKTTTLNHVAVRVTDVDKAKDLQERDWAAQAAAAEDRIPGGGTASATTRCTLSGASRGRRESTRRGRIWRSKSRISRATKARVEELGLPYLDGAKMVAKLPPEAQKMVGRQLWIRDPDGNVIELRQSAK